MTRAPFVKRRTVAIPEAIALLVSLTTVACSPGAVTPVQPMAQPLAQTVPEAGLTQLTPELMVANTPSPYAEAEWTAPVWIPGTHALLIATTDETSGVGWIELRDVNSQSSQRLVRGSFPLPAPDGKRIALIVDTSGSRQVAIFTMHSHNLEFITNVKGGVGEWWEQNVSFAWSPDSRSLALGLRPRPTAWLGDAAATPGRSTAEVLGGQGDVPVNSELFIYDLATRAMHRAPIRSGGRIGDVGWFPDGRRLIYSSNHAAHEYHDTILEGTIRTLDLITGRERAIAAPGGLQQSLRPKISPDGRLVAFQYHADSKLYDFTTSIGVVADTGGPIRRLTEPSLTVSSIVGWAADGQRVFFLRPFSPYRQIYGVGLDGELQQITAGPHDIGSAALSEDGSLIARCQVDGRGGKTVTTMTSDGKNEKLVVDLTPFVRNFRTGAIQEVSWRSRDGLEIRGLLLLPIGFKMGTRYPLVVDVHGGGEGSRIYFGGALLRGSALEWQLWANLGYAVFVPDYRHSGNYGWRPILEAREKHEHYERDFDDIETGVDYLIGRGIVDPSRLAIIGASAGAYRVNWAITHSHRFRVAVSYEGWGEEYFLYGLVPGGNRILEWENGGLPWDVPQNYIRNSPAFSVKGVSTPTLFIAGGETVYGGAVPQYTTYFMYAALRQQGVDAKLVKYRLEGHIVTRPENKRHIVRLISSWVNTHMMSP